MAIKSEAEKLAERRARPALPRKYPGGLLAAKAPATRGRGKATFKGGKTPRVPSQSYGQAQGRPTRKSPVIRTTGGGLPAVKVPTMTPGGDYKLPLVRGRERVYGLAKGGKIVSQRGKATAKRR